MVKRFQERDASACMRRHQAFALAPVVKGIQTLLSFNLRRYGLEGRPIGMITPTDILRAVAAPSTSNIGWRFQAWPN